MLIHFYKPWIEVYFNIFRRQLRRRAQRTAEWSLSPLQRPPWPASAWRRPRRRRARSSRPQLSLFPLQKAQLQLSARKRKKRTTRRRTPRRRRIAVSSAKRSSASLASPVGVTDSSVLCTGKQYWPLVGGHRSWDLNTGLWLVLIKHWETTSNWADLPYKFTYFLPWDNV